MRRHHNHQITPAYFLFAVIYGIALVAIFYT
jgi:hypothetical protein